MQFSHSSLPRLLTICWYLGDMLTTHTAGSVTVPPIASCSFVFRVVGFIIDDFFFKKKRYQIVLQLVLYISSSIEFFLSTQIRGRIKYSLVSPYNNTIKQGVVLSISTLCFLSLIVYGTAGSSMLYFFSLTVCEVTVSLLCSPCFLYLY